MGGVPYLKHPKPAWLLEWGSVTGRLEKNTASRRPMGARLMQGPVGRAVAKAAQGLVSKPGAALDPQGGMLCVGGGG